METRVGEEDAFRVFDKLKPDHDRTRMARAMRPCGWILGRPKTGLDGIPLEQAMCFFEAFARLGQGPVIGESIFISGDQHRTAALARQVPVAVCFLDTPLETCFARIQERNGGKPVKEGLISQMHRRVQARRAALDGQPGITVHGIRHEHASEDLRSVLNWTSAEERSRL